MSPDEPNLPPQEEPDTSPAPEIEPADTPEELPPFDPGGGGGDFGQPMA